MYYICLYIVKIAFSAWFNIKFEGRENIPKGKAVIFASNHRSYADPPVIVIGTCKRFSFMAKQELFRNKLFGWLIGKLGAFPVTRGKGDTGVIDTAVERIADGQNLVIFPEGTRSKDGKVGRGKTGAALIAAKSGAPIIPVGITFEGEKLHFRSKINVQYGKPIDTSEFYVGDEEPNPRQLVKLKNLFMGEIKRMVEGEEATTEKEIEQ